MKYLLSLLAVFSSTSLFAQGAKPAREGNFMQTLIMIGIAIIFFYFILWRPERKRRKMLEEQRSKMQKGDRVTAMGIVGALEKVEDKTVILKMVDGSQIEVLKAAISDVQPSATVETKQEAKS